MNWGKGIIIGMSSFIVFIVVLVVILMRQNVNLESADYYSKEINYQDEIAAMNNAHQLNGKVNLLLQREHLVVQLPDSIEISEVQVNLTRPDNNKLDKSYNFNDTRSFLIEKKELTKGSYKVEISYKVDGKSCLQKESIYI